MSENNLDKRIHVRSDTRTVVVVSYKKGSILHEDEAREKADTYLSRNDPHGWKRQGYCDRVSLDRIDVHYESSNLVQE